jgi:hypothetical protein
VISPKLSRPLANLLTKPIAACFSGAHELLVAREPERSTTIMMLTSRRTAVPLALTVVAPAPRNRMNRLGAVTLAPTVTLRGNAVLKSTVVGSTTRLVLKK